MTQVNTHSTQFNLDYDVYERHYDICERYQNDFQRSKSNYSRPNVDSKQKRKIKYNVKHFFETEIIDEDDEAIINDKTKISYARSICKPKLQQYFSNNKKKQTKATKYNSISKLIDNDQVFNDSIPQNRFTKIDDSMSVESSDIDDNSSLVQSQQLNDDNSDISSDESLDEIIVETEYINCNGPMNVETEEVIEIGEPVEPEIEGPPFYVYDECDYYDKYSDLCEKFHNNVSNHTVKSKLKKKNYNIKKFIETEVLDESDDIIDDKTKFKYAKSICKPSLQQYFNEGKKMQTKSKNYNRITKFISNNPLLQKPIDDIEEDDDQEIEMEIEFDKRDYR